MAPMPTPRQGAVAGVIEGKLYVAGGCCVSITDPFPFFHTLEVYDPATDTWASKAPMPIAVTAAAGGVIGGKLYVAGGVASASEGLEQAALQVYDAATDSWSSRAPMPVPNSSMTAGVINGKLYVTGGTLNDFDQALRVYDPIADTWTERAPLLDAGAGMATSVINGRLFVTGGSSPPCSFDHQPSCMIYGTLRVYDPATDTWDMSRASMTTPRLLHATSALNGQLHAIGGDVGDVLGPPYAGTTSHEVYDPATNTWTTLPPMTEARHSLVAAAIDGRLYVAGGVSGADYPTAWKNILEVYTPAPIVYSTASGHVFLQPINLPPQAQSVFKIGSTIPVKFKLFLSDGITPATGAVATIQVNKVSSGVPSGETETVVSTVPNQGVNFRYDATSQQYIFSLSTKNWSVGVYQITALLDDGSQIAVNVGAR